MTDDRDVATSLDVTGFVAELRRLADALEQAAEFTIHVDGEDVTIPEGAQFSIAHEREGGDVELEFQVTWSDAAADDGTAAAEDHEASVNETEVNETAIDKTDTAAAEPALDKSAGVVQA